MKEEVREEVEDIAEKTRVVPVTMIVGLLVMMVLFTAIAVAVYRDTDEGDLDDPQGIVDEEFTSRPTGGMPSTG